MRLEERHYIRLFTGLSLPSKDSCGVHTAVPSHNHAVSPDGASSVIYRWAVDVYPCNSFHVPRIRYSRRPTLCDQGHVCFRGFVQNTCPKDRIIEGQAVIPGQWTCASTVTEYYINPMIETPQYRHCFRRSFRRGLFTCYEEEAPSCTHGDCRGEIQSGWYVTRYIGEHRINYRYNRYNRQTIQTHPKRKRCLGSRYK
ncbi:hypothetical protein P167DRAFT_205537 [Morchella conica CCBAS932]|uniref:Uncharacterized protein n=1 Tax=Morchella conica CCBAS932 TaxID=1392247 RepID=A0A3N4L5N3_9PEZI|nr:hypothetical protein P167DRAFT_205537 [Morchella conica CCBAS932]